jgi:hypothetical protein
MLKAEDYIVAQMFCVVKGKMSSEKIFWSNGQNRTDSPKKEYCSHYFSGV